MEEPLVSIILSNYNGLKHLKECFDSLNNLDYQNFEIIFIDNCSQDKSVEFIKNNYPHVRIIQNEKDYGFSGANNIAAKQAKGEYIAFLNIDTVVDKNWLKELVKVAEKSKDIGIVVSKMYYYHNKTLINYAGGCFDGYGKTLHIGENQKDKNILNVERETFYACFAAALIKRRLYNKIELFDSIYYAYSEDLDLSWRAWISGYRVIYTPKSFIYHKIGQIIRTEKSPRKTFYYERNILRTILKNYESSTLIKVMPIYIGRRIGIIIRNTIRLRKNAFISVYIYIKSFLWNIIHFRSFLILRKKVQMLRKVDDNYIFKLMNKSKILEAKSRES